jgi:hypothetical protein
MAAGAGPLALLVVPKCPLCLLPLLGFLGIAVSPIVAWWMIAAVIVTASFVLLRFARKHSRCQDCAP